MTNKSSTLSEERHRGNCGLFRDYLHTFPRKKITSLSDLEARRETTKCFGRLMMNYSHMLTEEIFFEIFLSNSIYIMDLMCDKSLQ